ncbi:MAG: hypothetical protein UU88_C0010G0019 [Parcubacteria group bacterium GW2011_GWC1_42_11]|uniref:Uncharacterized protein n=1 Tax=Candidatus Nomurabacteria bacterium GW2011_GWC2_42_20 TaxID=1618756 RepID=A0A0G0ZHV0_9BACT|nr:MAG: hypothetical protein UU88_C0010G0019 [Parcubacteria group bacterium GW2011_GWC1_42_11]KKS48249.1 MAG: hypothetical protein UV12_C0002G0098 [Candidatus Nomurabacteria bacterium GW2011_GWC2_42_20]KKS58833.1 MAG: hypothetical protein UV24_C0015G0010 [Candidatus Nomurabacteria bacterium GW2011_GWA2_42_41]KKT09822.1 MAG: hypothetical protein UV86_C0002G0065 [Candidatus Nomurabacteria bacterium GW2011_GWB1_43_20]TAN36285.1 MAG: hypothetical protein EPN27_02090 [Patescibacteria group bacterium
MRHSFNLQKKLLLPLFSVIFFFSVGTQRADALVFVPVNDAALNITTDLHAGFQDVAKMGLDSVMYAVGQQLLTQLTDSTVNWIKSGFNGNPLYAIDPTKLFLDTANVVSGGMANQIRGIATCNFTPNFNANLANRIELSTRTGANARFSDQITCPFPTNVNPTAFYSDFSQGGWSAFEASLSDSGNPFGVNLLASQELALRQAEAQSLMDQKLNWANGFLSMEACSGTDPYTGIPTDCKTTTPGKVISDTLSKSIGTDMDRMGFADNMNKVISAFVASLTSSVTSGIF